MAKISNKRTLHRRANEHTLMWLDANYELKDGICLPRCLLYHHYLDYMRKKSSKPIGAAAFGKLVRQKFPKITTRRLGTRGQSKYHYYGVGIKRTSIYYEDEQQVHNQNKLNNRIISQQKILNKSNKNKTKTNKKSSIRTLKNTIQVMPQLISIKPQLRHFPRASDFIIPFDIQRDKLSTFLIMYRSHCQRILDTYIVANSEEVYKYLSHFWSGIPQHLTELLEHNFMVNVIECSDSVLYSAIEDALTPKTLYEVPEHLIQELMRIVNSMPKWIEQSMKQSLLSHKIMNKKLEVLQQFSTAIRRQLSFLHLVKSCKIVVSQSENVTLMCREIQSVETQEIWSQIMTLLSHSMLSQDIYTSFCDLNRVLSQEINFEHLTDWINNIVDKFVVNGKCACLTSRASQLVFALGTYLSGIIRDLTLNNAKSFGFWHLLFLAIEEYTLLRVWRSIRLESQSVRRLTIMKQPLNACNVISQSMSSNEMIEDNYTNLLTSISCYPWDQFSDDDDYSSLRLSHNSSTVIQNEWLFNEQQYLSEPYMSNDYTITSDGSVYTCLT